MSKEIPEGDSDMVSHELVKLLNIIQPLIEGKFMDSFSLSFELDNNTYSLELKKIKQ